MSRPRLGLALGSGGARGIAHCGVLDAIHEAGLPVDVVAGTSMGSIVGALYAREPDPAVVWRRIQAYVDDDDFSGYWATFVPHRNGENDREGVRPWHGLFDYMQRGRVAVRTMATASAESRDRLEGPLARVFGKSTTFGDLARPFAAVAMELVAGDMVVYRDGSLLDAVYASSAIPGIFPPVKKNGTVIVDGGGAYRVPVEACRALGADFVVAVDIPGYIETNLRTGFDLGMRSNTIARDRLNEFVCATADVLIRPDVAHIHWADFKSADEIRRLGYEATREALPELKRLWRHRRSPTVRALVGLRRMLGAAG